jgi:pimeloyl-ACP methyl ester carboxylesterase
MNPDPVDVEVPVPGGKMHVARWGSGSNVVLAAHGITASSMSWRPVVRHLDEDWTLLAPDLRGRGRSAELGGPYGLARHADDLISVADHHGVGRAVLAGQSLGAFVAVLAAARRPDLVERLVLVDGGLPLPIAVEGADPDAILEATLGPALARLRQTFDSVQAYFDFSRGHPAMSTDWNADVEAYLRYDLVGEAPRLRPAASEEAVRADGRDLLTDSAAIAAALRALRCPVVHLRAERGLNDQPPGLQPAELVDAWSSQIPDFTGLLVEDTNHYSIALGKRGARCVAECIVQAAVPVPSRGDE